MAGKGHILIVDDNEYNRELLVQDLEDAGFAVETAADGLEALAAAERMLPRLILLDVMMPGMSGIQVCQRLRQQTRGSDVPIIMVTAKSDSQDIVAGLKAGANDYVTKPIDMDVLMARVETHLKLFDLQQESRRRSERVLQELEAARVVQNSLLPRTKRIAEMPKSYGLEVAALWKPASTLGGDFWDLVSLGDGSLGILLIDFAGSGVVPALNTFQTKTFLQGQCRGLFNAALAVMRMNAHLIQNLGPYDLATGMYVRYNPDRFQFTVASAGAPAPLIIRGKSGAVETLRVSGQPLGALRDAIFDEVSAVLEIGDKLIAFTDGILKCENEDGEPYSENRLREFLLKRGMDSPKEITRGLEKELQAFMGEEPARSDDVTVCVIEVAN